MTYEDDVSDGWRRLAAKRGLIMWRNKSVWQLSEAEIREADKYVRENRSVGPVRAPLPEQK